MKEHNDTRMDIVPKSLLPKSSFEVERHELVCDPTGRLVSIKPSEVSMAVLEKLRELAAIEPSINGAWVTEPEVVFFLRTKDEASARKLLRPGRVGVIWNWPTAGGKALSMTINVPNFGGRVVVPFDETGLEKIIEKRGCKIVIGYGSRFVGAYHFECSNRTVAGLREQFDHEDDSCLVNWPVAFWSLYAYRTRNGACLETMGPKEWLQASWGDAVARLAQGLRRKLTDETYLGLMREEGLLMEKDAPQVGRSIVEVFLAEKPRVAQFISDAVSVIQKPKMTRSETPETICGTTAFIFDLLAHSEENLSAAHGVLKDMLELALLLDPCAKHGLCRPWLDTLDPVRTGDGVKAIELDANAIEGLTHDYWQSFGLREAIRTGVVVGPRDVPIPEVEKMVDAMGLSDDISVEDAEKMVDNLLAEAVACRQWSMPQGAMVQLNVAGFEYAQFFEVNDEVAVKLLDARGRFSLVWLHPLNKKWNTPFMGNLLDEKGRSASTALEVLLASIYRDFLVVEERDRSFSTRRAAPKLEHQKPAQRVVYLPRVRYAYSPNIRAASEALELHKRAPHSVGPHLRKAVAASDDQRRLAAAYGFTLPSGFTFVRPHKRGEGTGEGDRSVVYRSRSAMSALYQSIEGEIGGKPEWFKFERDTATLMRRLGFKVEKISGSKGDDFGVDVYALSKDGKEGWALQCKCWRQDRHVGPDVVRELAGALKRYPLGTKGMIVTTSRLTEGAKDERRLQGILFMEGQEFAELVHPTSAVSSAH